MPERNEVHTPNVGVTFTKSSTKDGGAGYTIYVNEGVEGEEAGRVMKIALELRDEAEEVVRSHDA
jgi:hypothetical protein